LVSPEPVLTVEDIHTYYGDSYVLQGISLTVEPGRVSVVLGRNGMGKTTLIRSVMNLTPPARGTVRYRGRAVGGMPSWRVARLPIGLVPQGRRVFPSLTVRENLTLPQSALSGRSRRPSWTLERVYALFPRLSERAGQWAGSLSGGEQSMLSIGRALMRDPDLLVMDEPTEGLAPVIVQEIEAIIAKLRSEGLPVLLVEQNYRLAMALADDVSILAGGKTVWTGAPSALEADDAARARWLGV
jgi:branched-chain amino acid transport system ATP-binding protein